MRVRPPASRGPRMLHTPHGPPCPAPTDLAVEALDERPARYTFAFREAQTGTLQALQVSPARLTRAAHYWAGMIQLTDPPAAQDVFLEGDMLDVPFALWRRVLRDIHELEDVAVQPHEVVTLYYLLDFLQPLENTRSGQALLRLMDDCLAQAAHTSPDLAVALLEEASRRGPGTWPVQNAITEHLLQGTPDALPLHTLPLDVLQTVCEHGIAQGRAAQGVRLWAAWCAAHATTQEPTLAVATRTGLAPAFLQAGVSPCTLERLQLALPTARAFPTTDVHALEHASLRRTYSSGITRVQADERHALAACHDGSLALWDTRTGALVRAWEAFTDHVFKIHLASDVVVASNYSLLRVWDRPTGDLLWHREMRHEALQSATVMGQVLCVGDPFSGAIWRFDVRTGEPLTGWDNGQAAVKMVHHGNTLFTKDAHYGVKALVNGVCVQTITLPYPYGWAELVAADADALLLKRDRSTVLWDRVSDTLLYEVPGECMAMSRDWFLSHTGRDLLIFDRATGALVHSLPNEIYLRVATVDGQAAKHLFVADKEQRVRVLAINAGRAS